MARMVSELPSLPAEPGPDTQGDVARLLMGNDRSDSVLPVFGSRVTIFNMASFDLAGRSISCPFYERLRNGVEVLAAFSVLITVHESGLEFFDTPMVVLDIPFYPSFYDAPEGNVPMPDEGEEPTGSHSVTLAGWDPSEQRFSFFHLFSFGWGKDMGGTLPFDYVVGLTQGASVFRMRRPGPQPELRAMQSQSMEERRNLLGERYGADTAQSEWKIDHVKDKVVFAARWLIGAGTGEKWLQCALLLRGLAEVPVQVGWLFGSERDDETIVIDECFVWPTHRHKGYATALVGRALLFAFGTENLTKLRWIELAADALVNERTGTRFPSWGDDFEWTEAGEDEGWGVSRVTTPIDLRGLVQRLSDLHAPGGVHRGWKDGVVTAADHHFTPTYGLVIARDVWPEGHEEMTAKLDALDREARERRVDDSSRPDGEPA